jgi:hypothetical protein
LPKAAEVGMPRISPLLAVRERPGGKAPALTQNV